MGNLLSHKTTAHVVAQNVSLERGAACWSVLGIFGPLTNKLWGHADTTHMFTMKENDWGFNQFMLRNQLMTQEGFCVNDTIVVEVMIRLDRFESFYYNSKKETGHVGLKNQGATCYMNSLLQTLYNLNHFRKVCKWLSASPNLIKQDCRSSCPFLSASRAVLWDAMPLDLYARIQS